LFPGVGYLLVLETSKDAVRAVRRRRAGTKVAALPAPAAPARELEPVG
jgi:hypothetical protein